MDHWMQQPSQEAIQHLGLDFEARPTGLDVAHVDCVKISKVIEGFGEDEAFQGLSRRVRLEVLREIR